MHISDKRIRIREGQKHVHPVDLDPDPQHCFGLKDPDRDPDPSSWGPLTSLTFKMETKENFLQLSSTAFQFSIKSNEQLHP
jgi:hypothetical protein